MQKVLFDKEIVNNQLSVLNNTLNSQRQTKKTLLSYLEKFSNAMYDNFNSESTDLLLSLINEAHSVFECIKSNINKTLELKKFLENISQSAFLNTIDAEKFNTEYNLLFENISKTNSNYLNFMNNYENFIKPNLKENILETITPEPNIEEEPIQENIEVVENNIDNIESITQETTPQNISETVPEIENIVENVENSTEDVSSQDIPETVSETENAIVNVENSTEEEFSVDDSYFSTYLQEKVLIINKKSGFAILPYSISDLDELFLDNPEKYSSIQDIIDKEYTVSLDDYENTSISRYKEAFKLAKEKSNYSFSQAANFAKDLLIENKVSTLIIAACKNIDELEYYIECLNNDRLEKFNYFKIIEQ